MRSKSEKLLRVVYDYLKHKNNHTSSQHEKSQALAKNYTLAITFRPTAIFTIFQ